MGTAADPHQPQGECDNNILVHESVTECIVKHVDDLATLAALDVANKMFHRFAAPTKLEAFKLTRVVWTTKRESIEDVQQAGIKVCVVGRPKSGKTCIMARLCGEDFVDDYRPTIIANFKKVLVPVVGNSTVKLILWGWEIGRRDATFPEYSGTAAILLVYDISHPESLRCLSDIIFEIRRTCQKRCKFLLCGNKADTLESGTLSLSSETAVGSSRKVSYSQGLEFARHNNLDGFVEVSAKTMRNMDQMCAAFGRLALEGSKANKKMPVPVPQQTVSKNGLLM